MLPISTSPLVTPDLAARLERLLGARPGGPLLSAEPVAGGGYTPTLRLRCVTARGSCFVKVGATPLTAEFVRDEIANYRRLGGPFMPELLAWEDHPTAPILAIEDLSHHHWPPPWEPRRVALVLAQVKALHRSSADMPSFAEVHGSWTNGWHAVAADPAPFLSLGTASAAWLEAALPRLIAAADSCSTKGDDLCHWDIRSDNICLAPDRAILVDWNLACRSNAALDLGFWLPSLAFEGGPPPEAILPGAPEVAAWVAGFFAARAGLPAIPDAPRVRLVQRQQLSTALPWAARALGLPVPSAPR